MGTQIVKPEVLADIPQTDIARPELETALTLLERDAVALPALRERANSITITDADTYAQVGAVLSEVRTIKETPKDRLGSFYTVVRRVITFLDTQSNKVKNACTEIEGICLPKMKAWEQRESAEAKEENAKPAIPSVPGYRRSTTYHATFDKPEDFDKMLKRFFTTKSRDERTYLRKFMTWDDKELNKEAREVKDPKALEKKIPGCRAWSA
jgi:hypothetical protein